MGEGYMGRHYMRRRKSLWYGSYGCFVWAVCQYGGSVVQNNIVNLGGVYNCWEPYLL